MENTVTLVPVGLQWKAYSRRRLISQHAVRTECERLAVFLGWEVANPTYPGPRQPLTAGQRSIYYVPGQ